MKKRVLWFGGAAMLACSTAAVAGPKQYSHKAGVAVAELDADQGACLDAAQTAMKNSSAPNPYNPVTQSTAAGAMGAAFASGIAKGLAQGRIFKVTYYNCMKSRGYTQRELPEAEWKVMKKLPKPEQAAKMQALVAAPEPQHPEMPQDKLD